MNIKIKEGKEDLYDNTRNNQKAVDYAKENNIKNIVVATTTGGNLTYLEDEKIYISSELQTFMIRDEIRC